MINYTVMKIDDRAIVNTNRVKQLLSNDFIYNDITFIDAKLINVFEFLSKRNVAIRWHQPMNMRAQPYMGELGCAASHIVACEYLIENNLTELMVLEDDAELSDNFPNSFNQILSALPPDYDYLTLCPSSNPELSQEYHGQINIDNPLLIGSHGQTAGTQAMIYSRRGAEKLLQYYKEFGFMVPIDIFIYGLTRFNKLNGFVPRDTSNLIIDINGHGSIIGYGERLIGGDEWFDSFMIESLNFGSNSRYSRIQEIRNLYYSLMGTQIPGHKLMDYYYNPREHWVLKDEIILSDDYKQKVKNEKLQQLNTRIRRIR